MRLTQQRSPRAPSRPTGRRRASVGLHGLALCATVVAATALPPHGTAFAQSATAGVAQPTDVSALQAPSEREGEYAEIDGARIFYESRGDGPPLMLLHGYPLSGALFARLRDELDDNHTVITIDHRGYGLSEADEQPGTIEQYAADALAVMEELGIGEAAIGGMSMGGPIAFEMFRREPDRFTHVILIDTIAASASPMEAGIWDGAVERLEAEGLDGIVPFLMPQMLTGETRRDEPAQADYLTEVMRGASLEAAIGGAKALRDRPDSTATLDDIEVPTLVLVGLADPVYAYEVSQGMVDAIGENAEIAIIDGASHAAVFEQPVAAAAAIEGFLSGAGVMPTGEDVPEVETPDESPAESPAETPDADASAATPAVVDDQPETGGPVTND